MAGRILESMAHLRTGVLAACIGLAIPASASAPGLLSATATVIAILADDLFLGEAEGHVDGAGTLAIYSQKTPALTCVGQFTSSAELGGEGQLHCSDSSSVPSIFNALACARATARAA